MVKRGERRVIGTGTSDALLSPKKPISSASFVIALPLRIIRGRHRHTDHNRRLIHRLSTSPLLSLVPVPIPGAAGGVRVPNHVRVQIHILKLELAVIAVRCCLSAKQLVR